MALLQPEDVLLEHESLSNLSRMMEAACLSEKEKYVVERRFSSGDTLGLIGEEMSLSRERVRQLQNEALGKIKRAFKRADLVKAME